MTRHRTFLLNQVRKLASGLARRGRSRVAEVSVPQGPSSIDPERMTRINPSTTNGRWMGFVDQMLAVRSTSHDSPPAGHARTEQLLRFEDEQSMLRS